MSGSNPASGHQEPDFVLALVFDVTTLLRRSDLRPTGIDRVQLEIAMEMASRESFRVAFCAYDPNRLRFDRVHRSSVLELGRRMRGEAEKSRPQAESTRVDREPAPLRLGRSFARRLAGRFPVAFPHLRRVASHSRGALIEVARALRCVGTDLAQHVRKPLEFGAGCFSREWTSSTTYCSVGMDWMHNDLDLVAKQKSGQEFRTALMVHDLLPYVAPQFSGIDLDDYFLSVLSTADTVIVNSDATARDLQVFARDHDKIMPETAKLPMGSVLADLIPERPDSIGEEIVGRYVLCVGTVTIRKNHHLLFDVWERLISEVGPDEAPTLIVAGAKGWISDETMSRLERTPAFKGVVHHIADATDENIAWLYEHCAFTVYPSFYEGWGLPVSESHDFGKLCLTSDRSSLPEAGEGLAELLDPYDRRLWLERINLYLTDAEALTNAEQRVQQDHVRITARDSAEVVLELAGLHKSN